MSVAGRILASVALCSALIVPATAAAQGEGTPPPAAQPAQAPLRIAVLDTQKVLRATEEGIRIEANLRKVFDKTQAELLTKEKQLQQEYDDLAKEEKALGGKTSAALERKKNEFKIKYQTYQQAAVEFQKEFQRKQNELYNPMLKKVGSIVRTIAQTDGYDIVIDQQAAIHFRRDLDITERVIQAYNAGDSGAGETKKPKKEEKKKEPAPKK